ncbi:MAG: glycosyltransferase [bacterium]|nr:glycosyltransferase [bacterium]
MEAPLTVAYVVVMFPCYSETFVLREILELRRRGVRVPILSLRRFSERIMDEDARPLLADTLYSPYLLSLGLIRSNVAALLRRPRAVAGLLRLLVSTLARSPRELLKNLALFPKSVHFARLLRERGVRHVHAHFTNYPATAALIISRLAGVPFTMTAHAHDIFQSRLLLPEKVRRAERLFAISAYNRSFILSSCPGIPPEKVEVVHCGLDLSRLPAARRPEAGLVLSVGRLMAIKGFDTLVGAAAILRDRGVSARCRIVGEGPERGALEELVRVRGLGDLVDMPGERTPQEVLEAMTRAGVFVLASRPAGRRSGVMDGIPVSLMEAMAIGVPVVSCAVSGIPELVIDGETGLLVPPGDEERLAGAIGRLLADPRLGERLAAAGREKVRAEFNIERIAARLIAVFSGGGDR